MVFWACNDGFEPNSGPDIEFHPSQTFHFPKLAAGEDAVSEITMKSVGGQEVRLTDFSASFGDEFELYWYRSTDPAKRQNIGVLNGEEVFPPYIVVPEEESLTFHLKYKRREGRSVGGSLDFSSNVESLPQISLLIEVPETETEIRVVPNNVLFTQIPLGEEETDEITVSNSGQDPLEIYQLQLNGKVANPDDESPDGFWVSVRGENPINNPDILRDPDEDGSPGLSKGKKFQITVHYRTLSNGADEAQLKIFSNDPIHTESIVNIKASGGSPCLRVEPTPIDFGAGLTGHNSSIGVSLMSCGGETLSITTVHLKDEDGIYSLEEESLPSFPARLPAYDQTADEFYPSRTITLNFNPEEEIPYLNTLVVESNDPSRHGDTETPGILEIPILGRGSLNECPIAQVRESEFNVPPLEIVSLDGSNSIDPDGETGKPVKYRWSVVESPPGSSARALERFHDPGRPGNGGPADNEETPEAFLYIDLVGDYVVELHVVDLLGAEAPGEVCHQEPARVYISAHSDANIHVQLVWDTPEDVPQTDRLGTDVDLHLMHPQGENWSDAPLDCFYANPNPEWGPEGSEGDPLLRKDDTDGAGPEDLVIEQPENTASLGGPYRVGIYYYRAHLVPDSPDLPSTVTLRAFLSGAPAGEWQRNFAANNFWEVIEIEWPGQVNIVDRFFPTHPR